MSTVRPDARPARYTLAAFCVTMVVLMASTALMHRDGPATHKRLKADRPSAILVTATHQMSRSASYRQFTDRLRRSTGARILQADIPHPTDDELVSRGRKLGAQMVVRFDRQTAQSGSRMMVEMLVAWTGAHPCRTQLQDCDLGRHDFGSGRASIVGDDSPIGRDYAAGMTEGLWRYLRDDDIGAISLIDRALATHASTDDSYALRYRALALRHLHKYDDAVTDLAKALSIRPDWAVLYADRAHAYWRMGDHRKARQDSDRAVALCPKASALLCRAYVRGCDNDLRGALADCNRALQLTHGLPAVLRERGIAFAGMRRYREAERDFRRVLAADPDDRASHTGLAFIYSQERRYSACIAEATKAINLGPDSAYVHGLRARCFHRLGDDSRALRDLDEALRISPSDLRVRRIRANLLYAGSKYDRAASDYLYLARHDKSYPKAWGRLGSSYLWAGQYDKAIDACTKRLLLDPEDADTLIDRGAAYAKKGMYRQALADLALAVAADPKYYRAYTTRSFVYLKQGDYVRCIADCDEAIRLNPKSRTAYSRRGVAQFKMRHIGGAISDIARALRMRF